MIVSRVPLRITLGGGGTDLPSYYRRFGGYFLAAALDKYIYVCLNHSSVDPTLKLKYSESESVLSAESIRHPFFREALLKYGIGGGLELASLTDVPSGTGMGSSGSFLVCLLAALRKYRNLSLDPQEIAEEAFEIEVGRLGFPVGKQDPYIAAHGGITAFEIDREGAVKVRPLQVSEAFSDRFCRRTLLFYTGLRRRSRDVLIHQQVSTEKEDPRMLDNLHAIREIGQRIERAIRDEDLDAVGGLMNEHWQLKRQRSSSITNQQIDAWYETALAHGALGGKLMGAGGGGFLIFICRDETSAGRIAGELVAAGLLRVDLRFDFTGIQVTNLA